MHVKEVGKTPFRSSPMCTSREFCCGTPPSCLKVMGNYGVVVMGGGGGLLHFSVSPLGLRFGGLET